MFDSIRYKTALYLIKKAEKYIHKGDFKNIKKGLKYFKVSVWIIPPSKGLAEVIVGKGLKQDISQSKIQD